MAVFKDSCFKKMTVMEAGCRSKGAFVALKSRKAGFFLKDGYNRTGISDLVITAVILLMDNSSFFML